MENKIHSREDFIGKIFEHEWTDGEYKRAIYQVEFLSDSQLRWRGMAGFPKGKSDTEKYKLERINNNIYQFSWLANDGVSIKITYNFNNMTASGEVNKDEGKSILTGTLKIIK